MSASEYDNQNIRYTGTLSRPGSTKGNIYAHDGIKTFKLVPPGADGSVLVSDNTNANGVSWSSAIAGLGVGFNTPNTPFPAIGSSSYYLVKGSTTETFGMVLPGTIGVFWSLRPNYPGGWSTTPTNITGGSIDFYFGYVAADTQQTPGNFNAYSGSPNIQILGTSINTAATNFFTPYTTIALTVSAGQQFCIKVINNLTVSASPGFTVQINATIIFRY